MKAKHTKKDNSKSDVKKTPLSNTGTLEGPQKEENYVILSILCGNVLISFNDYFCSPGVER